MTNYELDMYVGKWNLKQIEINNIDQINLFSIENWKNSNILNYSSNLLLY
jgi:hypothetical protein